MYHNWETTHTKYNVASKAIFFSQRDYHNVLEVRKRTESEEISQICKGGDGYKKTVPPLYKCDFRVPWIRAHIYRPIERTIWTFIDVVIRILKKSKIQSHRIFKLWDKKFIFGRWFSVDFCYLEAEKRTFNAIFCGRHSGVDVTLSQFVVKKNIFLSTR